MLRTKRGSVHGLLKPWMGSQLDNTWLKICNLTSLSRGTGRFIRMGILNQNCSKIWARESSQLQPLGLTTYLVIGTQPH